jgi:hypothetical protein
MASEKKKSNSKSRSTSRSQISERRAVVKHDRSRPGAIRKATVKQHFVVCVRNDDYPASLELRKLYPVIEDAFAAQHGMLRVVDESGEDYLYPTEFFVRVELPAAIEKTLAKIA